METKRVWRGALCLIAAWSASVLHAETTLGGGTTPEGKEKVTFTAGADLVSSYLWRGQHIAGVCVQPSIGGEWRGLTFGAWGSTNFDNDNNEVDLTLGYGVKGFAVGVTDYFFPTSGWALEGRGGYFDWKKRKTAHQLEATVGYDFGELNEKAAVSITWNTMLYGDDWNGKGKRFYSSYFEVAYNVDVRWLNLAFAAGFTPYESFYEREGSGFNMVNLAITGSKDIRITDNYSLPVWAEVALNPHTENVYFAFGITF